MSGDMSPVNLAHVGYVSEGAFGGAASTNDDPRHMSAVAIYARDNVINMQAWSFWEVRATRAGGTYQRMMRQPRWSTNSDYRYSPTGEAIARAKNKRIAERAIGSTYWMPNPMAIDMYHEGEWTNSEQQRLWVERGLICNSKSRAIIIANAMITLATRT